MRRTRKLSHLVARSAGKLDGYRDLAVAAQRERDSVRDQLVSHVCINLQNTWGVFCRAYATSTVLTPIRLSGQTIVLGDPAVKTESDVVAAAMRRFKNRIYKSGSWTRRDEPAWHDPNTLMLTLQDINVSNLADVRSAFSLGSPVFDDLPVFRNFYAHRSEYTAVKARKIAYKYGIPMLERPTDILCRTAPRASQPVVLDWIDDMWATVQLVCS